MQRESRLTHDTTHKALLAKLAADKKPNTAFSGALLDSGAKLTQATGGLATPHVASAAGGNATVRSARAHTHAHSSSTSHGSSWGWGDMQARNQLSGSLEEIQKLNDLILATLVSPADAEDRIQQSADVRGRPHDTRDTQQPIHDTPDTQHMKMTSLVVAMVCGCASRTWCEGLTAWVKSMVPRTKN
jgi:hypothetical protein